MPSQKFCLDFFCLISTCASIISSAYSLSTSTNYEACYYVIFHVFLLVSPLRPKCTPQTFVIGSPQYSFFLHWHTNFTHTVPHPLSPNTHTHTKHYIYNFAFLDLYFCISQTERFFVIVYWRNFHILKRFVCISVVDILSCTLQTRHERRQTKTRKGTCGCEPLRLSSLHHSFFFTWSLSN